MAEREKSSYNVKRNFPLSTILFSRQGERIEKAVYKAVRKLMKKGLDLEDFKEIGIITENSLENRALSLSPQTTIFYFEHDKYKTEECDDYPGFGAAILTSMSDNKNLEEFPFGEYRFAFLPGPRIKGMEKLRALPFYSTGADFDNFHVEGSRLHNLNGHRMLMRPDFPGFSYHGYQFVSYLGRGRKKMKITEKSTSDNF